MLVRLLPTQLRRKAMFATLAAVLGCGVLATVPAFAASSTAHTVATTTPDGMANLPAKKATESCEDLVEHHQCQRPRGRHR